MCGSVGRLFRIGKQPINASLQAYANAVKPDFLGISRSVPRFSFCSQSTEAIALEAVVCGGYVGLRMWPIVSPPK
jgi:hypothetical protein